jgi:hypothetical protein
MSGAMNAAVHLRLSRDAALCILGGRGAWIRLLKGRAWITQQDDPNDADVRPGEQFCVARAWLCIVTVSRESDIALGMPQGFAGEVTLKSYPPRAAASQSTPSSVALRTASALLRQSSAASERATCISMVRGLSRRLFAICLSVRPREMWPRI